MSAAAQPLGQVASATLAAIPDSAREASAREGLGAEVLATLDHARARLELFLDFQEHLLEDVGSGPRLKELIRRRVAELTELREAGELGQHATVEVPAGLAADEAALVRFMDAFAIDHQAVAPEIYAELREHFDAAALTEIFWAVAIVFALARVGSAIGSVGVL